MADQYVGEIRLFAGNYAPQGWALCNGQTLSISENEVLYSLIGVTYGGDGRTTFALPDLRGRVPIHQNLQYPLGNKGGTETVQLKLSELPEHTHPVAANNDQASATFTTAESNFWGYTSFTSYQTNPTSGVVSMDSTLVSTAGGNIPHDNMMPSLTMNFMIATVGLYPSQY